MDIENASAVMMLSATVCSLVVAFAFIRIRIELRVFAICLLDVHSRSRKVRRIRFRL